MTGIKYWMCEPILGSHDPFLFYPITFLTLAHRNVDWHHPLNLSNNWLQKLGCVNQGDEVMALSPCVNRL